VSYLVDTRARFCQFTLEEGITEKPESLDDDGISILAAGLIATMR